MARTAQQLRQSVKRTLEGVDKKMSGLQESLDKLKKDHEELAQLEVQEQAPRAETAACVCGPDAEAGPSGKAPRRRKKAETVEKAEQDE